MRTGTIPAVVMGLGRHTSRLRRTLMPALALALVAVTAVPVDAATLTGAWEARLGSRGANGTASIQAFADGAGTLSLKLTRLTASATLPVTVSRGTCAAVGRTVVTAAPIRTSSRGAAARTSRLSASQVAALRAAATAGRVAIRVGKGSAARCGLLAARPVPAYVAAVIQVGREPQNVEAAGDGIWVSSWFDRTVSRVDPATNQVLTVVRIEAPGAAGLGSLAVAEGSLWVIANEWDMSGTPVAGSLLRIDPTSGTVIATIPLGKPSYDVVASQGAIWVARTFDGSAARIDPATNQVAATVPVANPLGIAAGPDAIWVAGADGTVSRIDPATNTVVAQVSTQRNAVGVAVGADAVWVTNPGRQGTTEGSLTRIDPATNQVVANVPMGAFPVDVAVAGGAVWVAMLEEPTVVRVAPATNTVAARIVMTDEVVAIDATASAIWALHSPELPEQILPPPGLLSRINF